MEFCLYCARLRIERSGFEPWPGTLCCVLRQDTLLSLASHPGWGGIEIHLVASCYGNRDKLRPDGSLGSYADLT